MSKDSNRRRGSRAGAWVVDESGRRRRFLRGMLTHDLMQRGLGFDDAYTVARAVRDRLIEHGEVTVAQLGDLVAEVLPQGVELGAKREFAPSLHVVYGGEAQPFSRGLLAQSLAAAGLDHDAAYRHVLEIQQSLIEANTLRIDSKDLALLVAERLEERVSRDIAGRYRLLRRVRQLPKPLVVYVGGASGTGKSTLSLQLAPLLRIYQINSTDTIRQVMRMVFSESMLPSLHRSSFELGRHVGDEEKLREELEAAFLEQATQVAVGVRAVVERAIVEGMSIFVEGVHLLPPLMPIADLEGAAYQLLLLLATEDEEVHRSHLLSRASNERPSDRYMSSLRTIRMQQEILLDRAEQHGADVLDTSRRQDSANQALELLVGQLEERLPWLSETGGAVEHHPVPSMLLVIDGLADRPLRSLGGRTPLEAALTPNLDRLAREGRCGVADPIAPGEVPDTAAGSLALFGQFPAAMRRGPIEAIGAGLNLEPGDIALRANLATLDDSGRIVDRRAGRVRAESKELAKALDRLDLGKWERRGYQVRVRASTDHRLAIVLRGDGLSSEILGSDPGDAALPCAPLKPQVAEGTDSAAARRTARLLSDFEEAANRALAEHPLNRKRAKKGLPVANCLLTRGAGRLHQLQPLQPHGVPIRVACVAGDRTVLAIASLLGASNLKRRSMTAGLDTDLEAKFSAAADALETHDLVVVHVKGADLAAHDRRPERKLSFLEEVDEALGAFLEAVDGQFRVAVAADHATLSETGHHGAEPVPVLIWGQGVEADGVERFSERAVLGGAMGRFSLRLLAERLFDP
ncbi:MAG: 2,3-bisphosphoglycerate-independent phosphoglycerate mutase [Acidobacteria bacterium]|nr:MAG: 2,3-bisphosphoglycerate-independent phosphoglycerate mutase [Acidobacteriota bacterium]REK05407.1 MAG: 2,3-bisphosphoglycerate-independent phosphoglycerate mutase [Acidobacteriota bacterium]